MPREKYVFICNKCSFTIVKTFDEIKICGWCTFCRQAGLFTHLSCTWSKVENDEMEIVETNATWQYWESKNFPNIGRWVSYDRVLCDFLERALHHGVRLVTFARYGKKYSACLHKMVQFLNNEDCPVNETPIRRQEMCFRAGGKKALSFQMCSNDWLCTPSTLLSRERRISVYEIKLETVKTLHVSSSLRDKLEYDFASSHFTRLLENDPTRESTIPREVVQVDCIIYERHAPVIEQYESLKRRFSNMGKTLKEILVFHGTDADAVQLIIAGGFKVGGTNGIRVKNGCTYGRGVYTSTEPEAAIQFGKGSGRVILAKVSTVTKGVRYTDTMLSL